MILQYVTKPGNVLFFIFNQNVSVNDSYILDSTGLVKLKTFVNKKNNSELTKTCQFKKKFKANIYLPNISINNYNNLS